MNLLNTPSQISAKICQFVQRTEESISDSSIETLSLKAEVLRLFSCPESSFTVAVREDVVRVLASPEQSVSTVNDYYQAFMLHQRAKDYGIKSPSTNLLTALQNAIGNDWIKEFNAE